MAEAFDVFNGDADGICALHQLRMAEPRDATLITGVKRDIRLLERLHAAEGARVTVLDVSLHENREALEGLLARGCRVTYFDHHFSGDSPSHAALEAHLDPSPTTCTSLLVNAHLGGRYLAWAVTAAYGDNLVETAEEAARLLGLTAQELGALHTLGELLNYNAYGDTLDDLHIHPADLYKAIQPYDDPLNFLGNAPEAEAILRGFTADMVRAHRQSPIRDGATGRVFHFPNLVWARRVHGVYANRLANETPERANALIVDNPDGTFRISVRAPTDHPTGADALCMEFPTGGGRAAAAGVSALPPAELDRFLEAFERAFA